MPILMKLSRIVFSDINKHQAVYLKEVDGIREFPIIIGFFEASSIDRRVKGDSTVRRPMTHDLICESIRALGGEIQDIYIHKLESQTYFANIRIKRGDELIEVDARPSDAIAIAFTCSPPLNIFIEESVLEQALNA